MPSAFVGRVEERERLSGWLAAAADGQPITVLIEGDAGVGKSRLVEWLDDTARRDRAFVLKGACIGLSGGTSFPYGPLVEAVRLLMRQSGQGVARRLTGPSWPALAALVSDFADPPPPVSATASHLQPRVFGAILKLADHLAEIQRAPLLMIFEDLHLADPSTLDLVSYVTKAKTDQRLMLVCSFRPVGSATRHPLHILLGDLEISRHVERLHLGPFSRPELDEFITVVAGGPVPDARRQRYFELSEGNAYYAEQLLLADMAGGFQSVDVVVPSSLRGLMLSRINQLSDDAAEVARIAAVAGRRLSDELLTAISDLDAATLERALRECVQQRILIYDSTDDSYAFEHQLLRDTAYGQVLPPVRRRLHARVAEALARQPGDTLQVLVEVAEHWFAARALPEAFGAAGRAAKMAARLHAFADAAKLYARMLHLWPDVPDASKRAGASRIQILSAAANAARWAGDVPQAVRWIEQALAEVDVGSAPDLACELYERLGSYQWEAGRYDESVKASRKAEELLAAQPPSAAASRVQAALATAAIRAGDYRAGFERAQRAADLARTVGALPEEGRALNSLGLALTFLGRVEEGEKALRSAVAIAADVGHLEDLFRAYGNLGVCLEHAGRLRDVVREMTEGLARAKEHGVRNTRQAEVLANNAATALVSLARFREAAELLEPVLREKRPVAESRYARLTRAEIFVAQGAFTDAQRLLDEVGADAVPDPRFTGPLYCCRALVALWRGELDDARAFIDAGLAADGTAANARVVAQLCATGLRIAADLRQREGPRGGAGAGPPDDAAAWADHLLSTLRRATPTADDAARLGEHHLLVRQCHAEYARVRGEDTQELWKRVADGWGELERPLHQAYALARQVDAYLRAAGPSGRRSRRDRAARADATAALRQALAIAERIGAGPLRGLISELAARGRLSRRQPGPFDLTRRELQVLRLMGRGLADKQIAQELVISVKTVSHHAGAIYRKLGVTNRLAAVAVARREGLIPDEPAAPSARER